MTRGDPLCKFTRYFYKEEVFCRFFGEKSAGMIGKRLS